MSVFNTARWDTDVWRGHRDRPGAGWGTAWKVWYQVGPTVTADLTEQCVELRWTTDSHTLGDGTFRGDLQPGKGSVRFWDPAQTLQGLDKTGAVWAAYTPTGATWCWFYDSLQRAMVPSGDASGADVVFTGLTWPARLTSNLSYLTFPAQTINARLAAIVAAMQSHTELALPAVALAQDPAGQMVSATAPITDWPPYTYYPDYLTQVRQAAANGVAWWGCGRDASGAGTLTLNYNDWDHVTADRTLDYSQIVSGVPVTQNIEWIINQGRFTATNGSSGAQTVTTAQDATSDKYGQARVDMRLWGDVSASGPERAPANTTLININNFRRDPSFGYLSNINMQSGDRWTAQGRPSSAIWDPTAHVFAPTETAEIMAPWYSGYDRYRIAKSDHTLNAAAWTTTHTLERYVPPVALP